jgi:N-methylhydantoinase A
MRFEAALDLRYLGQAFELIVPVEARLPSAGPVAADFHRRHLEMYGHADEEGEVEVVNLRLTAYGVVPKPDWPRYRSASAGLEPARLEARLVYFRDAFVPCPVYERERLPESAILDGPAIVEEFGATTVVFPGWRATLDARGNLALARREGAPHPDLLPGGQGPREANA